MTIEPVAHIRCGFEGKFGVPRQSGRVGVEAEILFEPKYRSPDAVRGLDGFSHIWLIFDFSEAHREVTGLTVRPPRLGGNVRVGVFASRSPFRPNSLGLSSVRLKSVEMTAEGPVLRVEGADLIDGTPIYDIKPYLSFTDSHPDAVNGYAARGEHHRLTVTTSPGVAMPDEIRGDVTELVAEDPRPSYIDDPERIYKMTYGGYEIGFRADRGSAKIISCVRRADKT
ncbi:MAG: tRNA (N6-threonylcarbamoyladenosine(37)-N6)-methyltransferase TrmO [Clostridia bacterium]|nr:tRNA (N6-threonylcarbamoyladenosine(37)-N6)-methyltransferase TrmO [Clostridia bacterium]